VAKPPQRPAITLEVLMSIFGWWARTLEQKRLEGPGGQVYRRKNIVKDKPTSCTPPMYTEQAHRPPSAQGAL